MTPERILLDVETQRDFFLPGGNCYQKNHRKVAKNIYRLFDWVKQAGVPVVSTLLRVRPNERGPLAGTPHCVEGTEGEKKLPRTIVEPSIDLGLRNSTDLPEQIFSRYRQVIFEKRDTDIFAHARAERLITELAGATFILCGVGVAHGLVEAAVGLRTRGHAVILAEDAVLDLDDPLAEMAYLRMEAKGVLFAKTSEIVAPKPAERAKSFRNNTIGIKR